VLAIILFENLPRLFVIAECHEFRMPQMIGAGPLQEIDPHDDLRFEPNAFFYFLIQADSNGE
jgi:hypothetical protein